MSSSNFETSARAVLSFLHHRLGLGRWMITRTGGNNLIILQTEGCKDSIVPRAVLRWANSFCYHMVKGNVPRIAPESDLTSAHAAFFLARQFQVKTSVGSPLVRAEGSLFDTLCAAHSSPQPTSIIDEQELVDLLSAMLSTILELELNVTEVARRAEQLEMEASTDSLTSVYNRRGWDRLLASEDDRCRQRGHSAAVLMIDLNGLKQVNDTHGHAAGDALIVRTASALRKGARSSDIVARLGGDEFGILALDCDRNGAESLLLRVRAALAEGGISASVGLAMRNPLLGLKGAWKVADQLMYEEKSMK